MNSSDKQQIETLFNEAVELSTTAQKKFLDRVCRPETPIRREVEALLSAYQDASNEPFQAPVQAILGAMLSAPSE